MSYKVTRSNERKGKTHKVVGPGGETKFFGDPNLKNKGNNPKAKASWYARHAKSLAANPHFRAYARETWADGGYVEDYVEDDAENMADGGMLEIPEVAAPTMAPEDYYVKNMPSDIKNYKRELAPVPAPAAKGDSTGKTLANTVIPLAASAIGTGLGGPVVGAVAGGVASLLVGAFAAEGGTVGQFASLTSAVEKDKVSLFPQIGGYNDNMAPARTAVKLQNFADGDAVKPTPTDIIARAPADIKKDTADIAGDLGGSSFPGGEYIQEGFVNPAGQGRGALGALYTTLVGQATKDSDKYAIDQIIQMQDDPAGALGRVKEIVGTANNSGPLALIMRETRLAKELGDEGYKLYQARRAKTLGELGGTKPISTELSQAEQSSALERNRRILERANNISEKVILPEIKLRAAAGESGYGPAPIRKAAPQAPQDLIANTAVETPVGAPAAPVAVAAPTTAQVSPSPVSGSVVAPLAPAMAALPDLNVLQVEPEIIPALVAPAKVIYPAELQTALGVNKDEDVALKLNIVSQRYAPAVVGALKNNGRYGAAYAAARQANYSDKEATRIAVDETLTGFEARGAPGTEELIGSVQNMPEYKALEAARARQVSAKLAEAAYNEAANVRERRITETQFDIDIAREADYEAQSLNLQSQINALQAGIEDGSANLTKLFKNDSGLNVLPSILAFAGYSLGGKGTFNGWVNNKINAEYTKQASLLGTQNTLLGQLAKQQGDLKDMYGSFAATYKGIYAAAIRKAAGGLQDSAARAKALGEAAKLDADSRKEALDILREQVNLKFKPYELGLKAASRDLKSQFDWVKLRADVEGAQKTNALGYARIAADKVIEKGTARERAVLESIARGEPVTPGNFALIMSNKSLAGAFKDSFVADTELVEEDLGNGRVKYSILTNPKSKRVAFGGPEDQKEIQKSDIAATGALSKLQRLDDIFDSNGYNATVLLTPGVQGQIDELREGLVTELTQMVNVGVLQPAEKENFMNRIGSLYTLGESAENLKSKVQELKRTFADSYKTKRDIRVQGGSARQADITMTDAAGTVYKVPAASVDAARAKGLKLRGE